MLFRHVDIERLNSLSFINNYTVAIYIDLHIKFMNYKKYLSAIDYRFHINL